MVHGVHQEKKDQKVILDLVVCWDYRDQEENLDLEELKEIVEIMDHLDLKDLLDDPENKDPKV